MAKLNSREAKKSKRERYIQHTQPLYVTQHIKAYYQTRKSHPEDIDTRYLIVHELAKFKYNAPVKHLIKLDIGDLNNWLNIMKISKIAGRPMHGLDALYCAISKKPSLYSY